MTGRLNRVIELIAAGKPAFGSSCASGAISTAWSAGWTLALLKELREGRA